MNAVPIGEDVGTGASAKAGALLSAFDRGQCLLFAGAPDVATAKVAALGGANGVGVQSYQTATQNGVPDALVTPSEMLALCHGISQEVDLPILLDMENGYGGWRQAVFWLKRFMRTGVAAVHVDDLRGEYVGGPVFLAEQAPLTEVGDFSEKIRALKDASRGEVLVTARTMIDMFRGGSIDRAIERLVQYAEAGADAVHVPLTATSDADVLKLRDAVGGLPLVIQGNPRGYYPTFVKHGDYPASRTFTEFASLGVRIYGYPQLNVVGLGAMLKAMQDIVASDTVDAVRDRIWHFSKTVLVGGYEKYDMGYDEYHSRSTKQ